MRQASVVLSSSPTELELTQNCHVIVKFVICQSHAVHGNGSRIL